VDAYLEHLQELLLSDLSPDGVSGIIDRTSDTRQAEGNTGAVLSVAQLDPNFLILTFDVDSTYGDQQVSTPTGKFLPSGGTYSTTIRFDDIGKIVPPNFDSLSRSQKSQILQQVFQQCDARVNCNCAHFYWGGMHEDLAKRGGAATIFQGTRGNGTWRAIHQASGGLKDPHVRICKHIKQVIDTITTYTNDILKKV
jgi:hypothetical protein